MGRSLVALCAFFPIALFGVIQPSTLPDSYYLATTNSNSVQRSLFIVLEIANDEATLLVYFPPIPSNAIAPTAAGTIPTLNIKAVNVTKSVSDIIAAGKLEESFTISVKPNPSIRSGFTTIATGITPFLDTDLRAVEFYKYQGVPFSSVVDTQLGLNAVPNPIPIHYRLLDSKNKDLFAWTSMETGLYLGINKENNFIIKVNNSFQSTQTSEVSFKILFDATSIAALDDGVYGTNLLVQVNSYFPELLENNLNYLSQLDIAQTVALSNLISEADGLLTSQNLVIELTDAEKAVVIANRKSVVEELRSFLTVSQKEWNAFAAANPNPTTNVGNIITSMQTFIAQQLAIANSTPLILTS